MGIPRNHPAIRQALQRGLIQADALDEPAPVVGISEADFTAKVIAFAQDHGWRVAHFRPARTSTGWRTAVQGDGKGFPDLVLIRGGVLMVAELKVGKHKPTPDQREWLEAFCAVGVPAHVWRPEDWPTIEATLARPHSAR